MAEDTTRIQDHADAAEKATEELTGIPDRELTDAELCKLADAIMAFSQQMTGITLHPYEYEFGWRICYSIVCEDADEITALFARQSGKTETVAVVVCGVVVLLPVLAKALPNDPRISKFKDGVWCGIYAPTYEQAGIMWSRMKTRMYSKEAKVTLLDPDIDIDLTAVRENMTLPNGSFVDCGTASPQASIEGKTYHLLLLEETQDISAKKILSSIHPMCAACITGDALIPLEDGRLVAMKDMELFRTGCFDESFKFKTNFPIRHINSGVQPCIKMVLNSGKEIVGTYDHPVIIKPRAYPRKPVWEQLQNIGVGTQIAVPRSVPFFGEESIGIDAARVLGMLVGDGSYGKDCSPGFSGEDKELHTFLETWMRQNGGKIRAERSHITKKGRKFLEVRCVSDVEGCAKGKNPAINLLREGMVYGQTKSKKRVPASIWTAPKYEVAAFIGGLVDTDGCVQLYENRRCTIDIAQANRDILVEVSHLLMKFGIHCCIRKVVASGKGFAKKGNVHYRLAIADRDSVLLFIKHIELLVKRKRDALVRAEEILAKRRSKRRASVIVGSGKNRRAKTLDNDLVWERVVRIEAVGERQVYDIEMPDPAHNFIANGIVVHNTGGSIVKIGTPNRVKSEFYKACRRNRRKDVSGGNLRSRKRCHFEFDYTVVQRHNPRYRKYVAKERERMGEDSDDFCMKYRLHWLLERGMFVSPDLLKECGVTGSDQSLAVEKGRGRHRRKVSFKRSPNVVTYDPQTPNIAASIDVGRDNSTVVTVGKVFWDNPIAYGNETRYPIHIYNWLELQGDDHEAQQPQIIEFLKNYRVSMVIIDATGKGDPIYSRLSAELAEFDITVIPFIFSAQSKDVGYKVFGQELRSHRISFPAGARASRLKKWQKFVSQMEDLEKSWRGQIMVVNKPKDDKEARDDYPDSCMLLCFLVNVQGTMEVEESVNPLVGKAARWLAADQVRTAGAWFRSKFSPRRQTRPSRNGKWD